MSKESTILSITDLTVVKKQSKMVSFLRGDKAGQSKTGIFVHNMNLSVSRNRIHGIVGESGSGKSLSMKCILGLIDFSPGIISGNIKYMGKENKIDILPKRMLNGKSKQWVARLRSVLQKNNLLFRTEYFYVSREELDLELTYVPVSDSIQVYLVDDHKHCTHVDFVAPSTLKNRLVRLKSLPDGNQIVAVSFSHISEFSSYQLKNWLDRIQQSEQIRGKRVSMILQDPQTFLNPYWSVEKQLKNIIRMQKTAVMDSLYLERNFTLRIVGSSKDFPVRIQWDTANIKRHLRQADIWIDGKSHSMLSSEEVIIEKGITHFWGFKTAGRQFSLLIHPSNHNDRITIKWDNNTLSLKLMEATLSVLSQNGAKHINMLNQNTLSINTSCVNKEGVILVELDLIIKSGGDFLHELEVNYKSGTCKLEFGLEEGATEGLDISKGEQQIATPADKFYAGFKIDEEEYNSFVLSHRDIRSPVDFLNVEATITITPKYDQDYVGNISLLSASNKKRDVEYGLLNSATEGEDEHLGEKDISSTLKGGIFEAGFIIGQEGDAIFSPKDFRSLRVEVDIDQEVSSFLSKVNLNDEDEQFRKQYPSEVSGGQGQRVMISLAMATKPEVLIADEPTTGLDVTNQTEVVQLFQQYKNQGRTIILISHDLNFISHLADYYTIMYAGVDMEHMTSDILDNSELLHPYTKQLLYIARSEHEEGFSFIEKDTPDPYRSDFAGCPFEPRCKDKDKITVSNGKHLCKSLFPPMVHVDSGKIIEGELMKNKEHYCRCWLFLKTKSVT